MNSPYEVVLPEQSVNELKKSTKIHTRYDGCFTKN